MMLVRQRCIVLHLCTGDMNKNSSGDEIANVNFYECAPKVPVSRAQVSSVLSLVPGLFVPKTFRSQERIVPMGHFRSRAFSFPGTFVPLERKFPGTFFPGERKFPGTFVPWTFRSEELSFPGLFVPRNFRSSDYFTRH